MEADQLAPEGKARVEINDREFRHQRREASLGQTIAHFNSARVAASIPSRVNGNIRPEKIRRTMPIDWV